MMKIFILLFTHELKRSISSYKFILMLSFTILISGANIAIQVNDIKERIHVHNQEKIRLDEKIHNKFRTYAEAEFYYLIKPSLLSIFAKGLDERIGSKINVSFIETPTFESISQRQNQFLKVFGKFDMVNVVNIILSLFIILLASNSFNSDKEEQILKLVYSNSIKKSYIFLGKYFSLLIVFLVPLVLIFISSVLQIIINPTLTLASKEVLQILSIFIVCLLYISLFLLISLVISLKSSNSTMALLSGLLTWIVLIFLIPNFINFYVNEKVKIPSNMVVYNKKANIQYSMETEFYNNFSESIDWSKMNYNPGVSFIDFEDSKYTAFPKIVCIKQRYLIEGYKKAFEKNIPILLSNQQKLMSIDQEIDNIQLKKLKLSQILLSFSPNNLFESSCLKLAGTDYKSSYLNIKAQVLSNRNLFLDYVKANNGYSYPFFTTLNPSRMHDFNNQYTKGEENEIKKMCNLRPIDVSDFSNAQIKHKFQIPYNMLILLIYNFIFLIAGLILVRKFKVI